ncbi:hypothetical protein ACHAWF_014183 [Thalassiosira exigua]
MHNLFARVGPEHERRRRERLLPPPPLQSDIPSDARPRSPRATKSSTATVQLRSDPEDASGRPASESVGGRTPSGRPVFGGERKLVATSPPQAATRVRCFSRSKFGGSFCCFGGRTRQTSA